jgi:hypothetical protein
MSVARLFLGCFLIVGGLVAGRAAEAPAVKKPLRILLFAGAPTREYQFLRPLLVREMEKKRAEVSVYLQPPPGRTDPRKGIVQDLPPERLLAAFPDLASYDVVIAFDPDWTQLSDEQLGSLSQWVREKGGGLIVVAGAVNTCQLAREAQAKKLKPVLDLYPVVVGDSRVVDPEADTSKPRRLNFPETKADRSFLKLADDAKDPLAGWEEFFTGQNDPARGKELELKHGFYNNYPVKEVKPGTVVLATFADPKARLDKGGEQPYLAVRATGKGQVVYVGSGELWRLRQHREAFHERLWLQLARYAGPGADEKPKEGKKEEGGELHDVGLEVQALRTLYYLKLNAEQMKALRELTKETAQPPRRRAAPKASDAYRDTLTELRSALAEASDAERIDALEEKLSEIAEREKPSVDDGVEVTAAARKRVPEVYRGLKATQVAAYFVQAADDVVDPLDYLVGKLAAVRGLRRGEWTSEREAVAEDVSWLVAGPDADAAKRVTAQVVALLGKARGLSETEFKAQRPELDKTAREIVGEPAPDVVLRHTVQHALALLLSNPRLDVALQARMK